MSSREASSLKDLQVWVHALEDEVTGRTGATCATGTTL